VDISLTFEYFLILSFLSIGLAFWESPMVTSAQPRTMQVNPAEWSKLYDFTGQTIVVTGGTGVIGGEIASALAALGAQVAVIGRNLEVGEEFCQRVGAEGGKAEVFGCDVLDPAAVRTAAEKIKSRFGRVDGLINAAGGNNAKATTNDQQKFFDLPAEALQWIFDLNVAGTITPCQVFGRLMAEQGSGAILNVTSMAASRPLTRVSAYSAAKAAISNFTQWLAVHLAQEYSPNIRVNAIAPGFFLGKQNRLLLINPETGELTPRGKQIIAHTPMGRFGDPQELLGAVLWLMSPAASFVTGAVVPIDGGFGAFSGV
jgi:NAD(P)-dependent dehydrogenase (short-subunit alcohol dehydrogenase family)